MLFSTARAILRLSTRFHQRKQLNYLGEHETEMGVIKEKNALTRHMLHRSYACFIVNIMNPIRKNEVEHLFFTANEQKFAKWIAILYPA